MPAITPEMDKIRTAFDRNARAMELRDSLGRGTAVTTTRVTQGLTCEVQEGAWKITADMGEKAGGHGAGPNPGMLGRAALGTCLAMGYVMWAARRGLPLDALEVEVQADYDSRGYHGVGQVEPGYAEVRYIVRVTSPAPEDEVLRLFDEADAHSDYLAVFARPQKLRREVDLRRSGT